MVRVATSLALVAIASLSTAPSVSTRELAAPASPHVLFILQDDLGKYDTLIGGNEAAAHTSGNVTELAREGILLNRHYVHWHCSPSRRSFLTGRLPIHHGEFLSGENSDDIDLRWSWLTDKLKQRNYRSYWYGKGHTGYKSMSHLPEAHGFDGSTFFNLALEATRKRPGGTALRPFRHPTTSTRQTFTAISPSKPLRATTPQSPCLCTFPFKLCTLRTMRLRCAMPKIHLRCARIACFTRCSRTPTFTSDALSVL